METNEKNHIIAEHELGEGHTPAAWICVIIMLVGFLVSAVAMVFSETTIFFVGLAVVCVGLLVGFILKKLGFGSQSS